VAERKPFLLRVDPVVHEALQRWANDEMRSLNGQVEFLLREALKAAGRLRTSGGGARPRPGEPAHEPAADRAANRSRSRGGDGA
jgi:hypothetical protein